LLLLTVFFGRNSAAVRAADSERIDQWMPIFRETERALNQRNSSLNSRAEISDGSGRRFFVVRRKNLGC
jgi:hypothetical protein